MRNGSGPRRPQPPIAKPIAAARVALKITQLDLARAIDMTPANLRRWERGTARPTPRNLERLIAYVTSVDADVGAKLRLATTGVAPPAAKVPSAEALRNAMWRAAEELDVPAARLRVAVRRVLEVAASEGFAVGEAGRALVADDQRAATS